MLQYFYLNFIKTMKKILIYNTLLVISFFLLIEYILFNVEHIRATTPFFEIYTHYPIKKFKKIYYTTLNNYICRYCIDNKENENKTLNINEEIINFRPILIGNNSDIKTRNSPIVLFGCSYTYGWNLDNNQTFSYKLYKETGRTVFNFGLVGTGVQQTLFMLQNNILKCIPQPEYIIYTFISDHINRLNVCFSFDQYGVIYYKYNENKDLVLMSDLDLYYWHSYILRRIYNFLYTKNLFIFNRDNYEFLLKHFLAVNNEIKKSSNNTKFVLFVYEGDSIIKNIEEELKKNGIIIIYLSQLSKENFLDRKYMVDDSHPNEKAWDVIVPLLIKKLNI